MRKSLAILVVAAAVAAAGCAGQPPRDEPQPHHFSKDKRGNKLACYATETANEYECVPVNRPYPYGYGPLYDPFWDPLWPRVGFYYGWPYYPAYPVPAPPPPAPPPPHRPR